MTMAAKATASGVMRAPLLFFFPLFFFPPGEGASGGGLQYYPLISSAPLGFGRIAPAPCGQGSPAGRCRKIADQDGVGALSRASRQPRRRPSDRAPATG